MFGQPGFFAPYSERDKDICYSSRTRVNTDAFRQKHEVRHAINELHKLLPQEIARTEQAKRLYARLRHRDGHRPAHLSAVRTSRRVEGL